MATTITTDRRRRSRSRLFLGAVIVLLGVLLLLDTTNVYETGDLVRYLPSLVVLWGLYGLVRNGFRDLFGPLVLVVGGTAWQLLWLDVVTWGQVVSLWPVLVIVAGLSILAGVRRRRVVRVDGDDFEAVSVLGEVDRELAGDARSGSAVAVLGDTRLDLRSGVEPPAAIDAVSILGDVELRVPTEWTVRIEVVNFLGDVRDRRPHVERATTPDLVVSGVCMLGDVEITD